MTAECRRYLAEETVQPLYGDPRVGSQGVKHNPDTFPGGFIGSEECFSLGKMKTIARCRITSLEIIRLNTHICPNVIEIGQYDIANVFSICLLCGKQ